MTGDRSEAKTGMRAVQLGAGVAGAFGARLLRLMGADVVQIEAVPSGQSDAGSVVRENQPVAKLARTRSDYLAEGKRSICISYGSKGGHQILERAAAWADCVMISDDHTQPSIPAEFAARSGPGPNVIVVVSPWRRESPREKHKASSAALFAVSGEASLLPGGLGYELFPEAPPLIPRGRIVEYDAGVIAALTCLAASYKKMGEDSERVVLEVTIREAEVSLNRWLISHYLRSSWIEDRSTRAYAYAGLTPCADGYVMFQPTTDAHWAGLVAMLGNPTWALKPDLATYEGRAHHGAEITRELQSWARRLDKATLVRLGLEHGVPVGAFREPREVLGCEQLQARAFFRDYAAGKLPTFAAPVPAACAEDSGYDVGPALLYELGFQEDEVDWLLRSGSLLRAPTTTSQPDGTYLVNDRGDDP